MDQSPEEAPRSNLRASSPLRWIIPLALLLGVGGYLAYRWLAPADKAPTLALPAPAPEPTAAPTTAVAAAPEEPPATAADAPALLGRASQHPLLHTVIALPELVRRWAVVTENLSHGDSPRRELAVLAPRGKFAVTHRGGTLVMAPQGWARYDEFAAAVQSVDAGAAASAYRRLHGVLDAAYRALGYKAGALDAATVRALRRLADAPVVREGTPLVEAEGQYVFEEARLEQLPDVEKHLLRMGPKNQAIIQAKARELLGALNLVEPATKR